MRGVASKPRPRTQKIVAAEGKPLHAARRPRIMGASNVPGEAMRATIAAIVVLGAVSPAFGQWPKNLPPALPLWPKGAPGSEARAAEAEEVVGANVCNVHNPTLTAFVPGADRSPGTSVITCP